MGDVKRVDVIDLQSFLRKEKEETFIVVDLKDVRNHFKSNRKMYSIAGLSLVMVGIPDIAFASTGIDAGARKIYDKLLLVGKWIIIIKGGIDIITAITNGEVDLAKKRFLGYLIAYAALQALPWGMDQVDLLFKEEA
jgi:hypothetical protein